MLSPERENPRLGFRHARIVLGVTGGIAAYKAADLTSKLMQAGSDVRVVMTEAAVRFVQPMTFQALTHQPVYTDVFAGWEGDERGHVTLAEKADLVLIAPATADIIARLAGGFVNDMLTAVVLATGAPLVIAPAMEHHMWHHPATQANLTMLRERGVVVIEPERGYLASGAMGDGRLASLDRILGTCRVVLGRGGPLAGRHIVITAGGTREPLDPVRYLGNGSTGAMGLALVDAATDLGATVTLIAGPTVSRVPQSVKVIRIESALEMAAEVLQETERADVLIMAAAVADFRPRDRADQKIKKQDGQDDLQVELVRNPDILAETDHPNLLKIGFAAETERHVEYARGKLERKGLAMIVANDAVKTIGSTESEATLIFADRPARALPQMRKEELAGVIMDEVAQLIQSRAT